MKTENIGMLVWHRLPRVLLVSLVAFGFVIGAALGWRSSRFWTSVASFTAVNSSSAQLRGLAAQLGFDPSTQASESPFFYVDLLKTQVVIEDVLHLPPPHDSQGFESTFLEHLRGVGKTDAKNLEAGVIQVRDRLNAQADRRTGIVSISFRDPSPVIAQAFLTALIARLDDFNKKSRNSRAANERKFASERMEALGKEMAGAEASLREFVSSNRSFRDAVGLSLEFERRNRELERLRNVYASATLAFEQARIDEVRDTPAITVVQPPTLPARRSMRLFVFLAVFGAVSGVILACVVTVLRDPELRAQVVKLSLT